MNINYLLNNTFSQDIAIDIGTDTTLIYIQGKGIALKEPSVIAFDRAANTVEAAGNEAKQMLGKAPKALDIITPIENGVISDYSMAEKMIKRFSEPPESPYRLPTWVIHSLLHPISRNWYCVGR